MKKMKMIILCALLAIVGSATAQTVKMTVENVVIETGGTADMTVSLETAMTIAGWQMYLYLPEGITLAYEEEDGERYYDNAITLSSRHKRGHSCSITETTDGGWLILCYDPSKPTEIKDTNGVLATITLQATDDYYGSNVATIKEVAVSESDNTQTYMEGEVTFLIAEASTVSIRSVCGNDANAPIYNLNGQRLNKHNRGINIVNGQKVVKK